MQQIASLTEAYRLAETRTIRLHKLMVERVVEQASYGFYLQLVQRLFECLITRQLPMLPSEGQDFLREMDRIQDLVHLITSPRGKDLILCTLPFEPKSFLQVYLIT